MRVVVRAIPVGGPLPDVASHVVEAVAVWGELGDGGDSGETIGGGIFVGEMSLEGVGHPLSIGAEFFAPDVGLPGEATTGGKFPFGFSGEALVGPLGVGFGVWVSDLHNGIVVFALDGTGGARGMAPICAFDVTPPLEVIVQR